MAFDEQRDDPTAARLRPVLFDLWLPRGPELSWQVVSLRGTEALSQPYEFEVELWCDDPDADFEQVLGADCELLLERNGLERQIYGVIAEIEILFAAELRIERDGIGARVKIVPAFRLLEQEVDTRFFSGQTVIEILAELLGSRLAAYERTLDVESRIEGQYNRRDYCVQFRESTFDFCSRIMQEEGIAYLFVPDPDQQRERMVLTDNNGGYAPAELLVPEVIAVERDRPEELDRESIQAFHWRHKRVSNRVLARGYNYKLTNPVDEGEAEELGEPRPIVRERVLAGHTRQIIDDPRSDPDATSFDGSGLAQQVPLARRVLEAARVEAAIGRGQSNAVGFAAGSVFELERPLAAGPQAQRFLLTRVDHVGSVSEAAEATRYAYENHFECLDQTQIYRPPRTLDKPRVHGVQTGIVIGKTPDEVHTDPLGRVRVAFALHGRADEHSSCWIRVAQIWAGPGYGAMVIPRVGMEVVVAFVDGDPDRPLITGCVYNGSNAPPYELPSQLSKSTFKTSSTPGGDSFSEVRIEDAAGSEQVFVRAQRRMDLRVAGSWFATCTGDREEIVGAPDESVRYSTVHTTTVLGDVHQVVHQDRFIQTMGDTFLTCTGDLVEATRGKRWMWAAETHEVTAPTIIAEASETISHKANLITLAGNDTISMKAGAKVVLESNNAIELRVGNSFICVDQGCIDIQGFAVRLNSGGGVGEASEALSTAAFEAPLPYEALPADDGRIHAGGSGGGGGGRSRDRGSWKLEPHSPPPMIPPALPKPTEPIMPSDVGGAWKSMRWKDEVAWCSEPTTLVFKAEDPPQEHQTAFVQNASDGELVAGVGVAAQDGTFERSVKIVDLLPRTTPAGVEDSRTLSAWMSNGLWGNEIEFRFLTNLERMPYLEGRSRFSVALRDHVLEISATIQYLRGGMGYIASLGDFADEDAKGIIDVHFDGYDDWRFCKRTTVAGNPERLAYWDGSGWRIVPEKFEDADPLGEKLSGMGLWKERGEVHTQYGSKRWPDELPEWTPEQVAELEDAKTKWIAAVNEFWSKKFDLERDQCQGYDPNCCRYTIKCNIQFVEVEYRTPGAIIIGANHARANSRAWALNSEDETVIHEFGHHLGNPDEYRGASTVDPYVNGDGAVFGIDEDSVMGNGNTLRRRHFDTLAKALAKLVAKRTGKAYTYSPVWHPENP